MYVNITPNEGDEVLAKIKYYQDITPLNISVFTIKPSYQEKKLPDEYTAHMVTARLALERENYLWNMNLSRFSAREDVHAKRRARTDFELLNNSGVKISAEQFLGFEYDWNNKKLLIGGTKISKWFHYDSEEKEENAMDVTSLQRSYWEKYGDKHGKFLYAMMYPPMGSIPGKTIFEKGSTVHAFLDFFFGDVTAITVYAWNNECSIIFEAGHEWWGSYFWTVYNPEKDWYVSVIASETD